MNIVSRNSVINANIGSPGVEIQIIDNSLSDVFVSPTSIAGIVGNATRGEFNTIQQIISISALNTIMGTGFSNYKLNQGYYAAQAILNNGGFVEYVRPYGEIIDPDDITKRELKSDVFLVSYNYNSLANTSITTKFFAATRQIDSITVKAASIGSNIVFSGSAPSTLDGVTLLVNDRILLKDQSTPSQNGTYYVQTIGSGSNGTWVRTTDIFVSEMYFIIQQGTVNANKVYQLATSDPIIIGTTTLTFTADSDPYTYDYYGTREIYSSQNTILNGVNNNFALDKTEDDGTGSNKIALFSIINLDPSSTIRGASISDRSGDSLVITPATYKTSKTISQTLSLSAQPLDADTFSVIKHDGTTIIFEFDNNSSVIGGHIPITIGSTLLQTNNTIITVLTTNITDLSFVLLNNQINGTSYYGVHDIYNSSTQNIIFTKLIDSYSIMTVSSAVITNSYELVENSIGDIFAQLGLCSQNYVKEIYTSNPVNKYILTTTGLAVAKLFVNVDYVFGGTYYTFYGTVVPYMYNGNNLNIVTAAQSVQNGFSFVINTSSDLATAAVNSNFNLGQCVNNILVDAATITNITLSGTQTIDAVSLISGNVVLVKNQTISSQNGVYTVNSGIWTRIPNLSISTDFNNDVFIVVTGGSVNLNTNWRITLTNNFILNNNPVNFYNPNVNSLNDNVGLVTLFTKYAYDVNDPATINDEIWVYNPRNIVSSEVLSNAWKLFEDKDNSNADYYITAGTCIQNLFVKGMEELDLAQMDTILTICDLRKDVFVIFDGIDDQNSDNVILKSAGLGMFGLESRWGAIFDGRSIFYDMNYTKRNVEVVKSIELGGIITRNRRGLLYWIPPAGVDYGTVSSTLSLKQKYLRSYINPDDVTSDISKLYAVNINSSRTLNGLTVIYGEKTLLRQNSRLNRLHVAMLLAGFNKTISHILDSRMEKLNTMALRNSLAEELRIILQGIQSASPSGLDNFSVICDTSNNTITTIENHQLIVDIELFPTETSEKIYLRTTLNQTGTIITTFGF